MEKYVKLLREKNIKITPQRLVVLKYLDNHCIHPTADKIYSDLKSNNPSLSKTTVYNSLITLGQHGIIQTITISGSEQRYDFTQKMHHHFYCKRCGNIFDMEIECPNVDRMAKFGHQVEEVHGYIKGICKDCLNR